MQSKPKPRPTLRRSLSDSDPHVSKNRRHRSTFSSTSSKSSWTSKLAKLLARLALFSRDSDLTEESLEAHNQRIGDMDDNKFPKSSPYYRGLTDSSLAIHRSLVPNHGGHAHHYASSAATHNSFSSIVSKFKDWNPCFGKNKNLDNKDKPRKPVEKIAQTEPLPPPSLASSSALPPPIPNTAKTRKEEAFPVKEREKREEVSRIKGGEEKLLRERLYSRRGGGGGETSTAAAAVPVVVVENGRDRELNVVERDRFTWGDKYRPKVLDDFICNRNKARLLKDEVRERRCGHYIFEGPPGVGKRTMIQAMLREAFGSEAMELKDVIKVFNLKSEVVSSIKVKMKESPQYVEVNLSQTNGHEKQVIVQLIKETHTPLPCNRANCRGIMICEADKLPNETLMYVKWVIERYKGCNKLFFCCSDVSKLQPLRSLCSLVQLLPPSKQEIVEVLEFIAKQKGFDLSIRLAERIADNSKNNLRQAIRSLEASWDRSQSFQEEDGDQLLTGWEDDIADVAKKIVDEQSPKQLYIVRGKLKKLIEHDVSPHFIFKTLVDELKKLLDEELQHRVESLYNDYNKNEEKTYVTEKGIDEEEMGKRLHDPMRKNVHHFLKIEEFIAKFMSCYKGEANKKNELPP